MSNSGMRNGIVRKPGTGKKPVGTSMPAKKASSKVTLPTSKKGGKSSVTNPTNKRAC